MSTRRLLTAGLAALACAAACAGTDISVRGLGLFGNFNMERRLDFLSGMDADPQRQLGTGEIDDIAYIILQQLQRDGHPLPELTGTIAYADGTEETRTWSLPFTGQDAGQSATTPARAVRFSCRPGILNYYDTVQVDGVDMIDQDRLANYFKPSGVLFTRRSDRVFTEGNLATRTGHLLGSLQDMGYLQAAVASQQVTRDPETGAVSVRLQIDPGRIHRVGSVTIEFLDDTGTAPVVSGEFRGGIFNAAWLRQRRQALLNDLYAQGYPDLRIQAEQTLHPAESGGEIVVDLQLQAVRGPLVALAGVRFDPDGIVREPILRRTAGLGGMEVFDLPAVERGRRNLLALGVFKDVALRQEAVGPGRRNAVYTLTPLPRQTLKLRAGWGSYERLRVGLRWQQLNLWNRAHRYELDALQSTKSSRVDLSYVVPHFFSRSTTGYARAEYDFREEISYDRTTSSVLVGASHRLPWPGTEATLEYSLERQTADRESARTFESIDEVTVASLTGRIVLDRRDSALYPTSGYDASLVSKTASEALGGRADFAKLELATSYHAYLGGALYFHAALRYGTIFAKSPTADNLPFTERFFAGGENSIRAYQRGEAAPRDANGDAIGAESYVLANLELEQRIFTGFSVVLFWDGLAQAADHQAVPDRERLHSAGIGLRLRTPVGPLRLEYGHNLDPRPGDPDGTLHFAVGYPF